MNANHRQTQCQQILSHLRDKGPITFLGAVTMYSICDLRRRVKDLRDGEHDGERYSIESRWLKGKPVSFKPDGTPSRHKRYKQYYLEGTPVEKLSQTSMFDE